MLPAAAEMTLPESIPVEDARSGELPVSGTNPDLLTLAAFGAFVVLVASNVVAVRLSNLEMPPFLGAGTRFAAASLLFFIYILIRRLPLPQGRALFGALLFGALQFGIGIGLAYWALVEVPAGLASVIFASVPLFTLLFAFSARLEPLRMRGLAGSLAAMAGIAVMFGERSGTEIPLMFLLAAVGSAASFALAPVLVKSLPQVHSAAMNAVGMLIGTLILLGLSFALREPLAIPKGAVTWAAQLYLVLPGSVGVFVLLLFLLKRWTATGVSYQSVLSPPLTIALSAWLLQEPLTGGLFLGGALVLAGVYLGALAQDRRAR